MIRNVILLSLQSEYQNSSLPCFSGVVETLPQSSSLSSLTTYTHTDLLGRENVRSNEEPATSSFLHLRDGFHTGDANVIGAQHGHIPYPVPLPIFSADLTMLLDTGQPILGEARTTFLQTCTDFYLQMKLFPSRTDISAVCAQLVQTFPQLADPGSVLGRMGFVSY